jgi:hypothetical protein
MSSSVRRADGHGRILAGRWLPLSIFNLDTELGYEPDLLAGLEVRKRGLVDALAEEGVLTLPPRHQDVVDALYWQRASHRQTVRMLAGLNGDSPPLDLDELVWQQWRDDPVGTQEFMLARDPNWVPPKPPPMRDRALPPADNKALRRARTAALRHLREWCARWVTNELNESEEA